MKPFVSKLPPTPKNDIPQSYSFVVTRHYPNIGTSVIDSVMFQERQAHAYCEHMGEGYSYTPVINRIFGIDYNGD